LPYTHPQHILVGQYHKHNETFTRTATGTKSLRQNIDIKKRLVETGLRTLNKITARSD